jgi:hypothetical protein
MMTNIKSKESSYKEVPPKKRNEVDTPLPNTPYSPSQSSTEGDLVDSDRDSLGIKNAPPTNDSE